MSKPLAIRSFSFLLAGLFAIPLSIAACADDEDDGEKPCNTGAECASGVCYGLGCGAEEGKCRSAKGYNCTGHILNVCSCEGETVPYDCDQRYSSTGPCPGTPGTGPVGGEVPPAPVINDSPADDGGLATDARVDGGQVPSYCFTECDDLRGVCPRPAVSTFEEARARLLDPLLCGGTQDNAFDGSYAGHCDDGVAFLVEVFGGYEVRFFDSSGEMLALSVVTDDPKGDCPAHYWPRPHACQGAIVEEVFCAADTSVEPGDAHPFPFSD